MAIGCEPHADVAVVLHDQCEDPAAFDATQGVLVTLLGNAGFDENGALSACNQKRSRCFDVANAKSFTAIKDSLKDQDVVLTASPGVGQGIVVTGFRDANCTPASMGGTPLTFCGYQLGPLPDEDTQLFVLVSCPAGIDEICWPQLFQKGCDE
jgi:hypothetical protein